MVGGYEVSKKSQNFLMKLSGIFFQKNYRNRDCDCCQLQPIKVNYIYYFESNYCFFCENQTPHNTLKLRTPLMKPTQDEKVYFA